MSTAAGPSRLAQRGASPAWGYTTAISTSTSPSTARATCFPVVEDTASSLGHLEVRTEDSQFPGSARSSFSIAGVVDAREQSLAKYPALAAFAWAAPVMSPIDPPPDDCRLVVVEAVVDDDRDEQTGTNVETIEDSTLSVGAIFRPTVRLMVHLYF